MRGTHPTKLSQKLIIMIAANLGHESGTPPTPYPVAGEDIAFGENKENFPYFSRILGK